MRDGTASRGCGGFTLVELLVVVGVIALLISILMPALRKARQQALQTACLSNMRQVGIGLLMYVSENKGTLPGQVSNQSPYGVGNFGDEAVWGGAYPNFLGSLVPYLKDRRVFICPAIDADRLYFGGYAPTEASNTNYMCNHAVMRRKLASIKGSSGVAYVQEWGWQSNTAWWRPAPANAAGDLYTWWHSTTIGFEEYSITHYKGGNLLFVDGHAEWRGHKDIRASDFGLTGDGGGPDAATGLPGDDYAVPHWYTYRWAHD